MKKLPEISIDEWMEAESRLVNFEPQPEGSITVEQYAEKRGCTPVRARHILGALTKKGLATSAHWRYGGSGSRKVYWLKPKSEWPK